MALWLSPDQAAARCPLSRKVIYRALREGAFPAARKLRGRWLIPELEFYAWIDTGTRPVSMRVERSPRARKSRSAGRGSLQALEAIERAHGLTPEGGES
jgi:excisionase family DNA binding protein